MRGGDNKGKWREVEKNVENNSKEERGEKLSSRSEKGRDKLHVREKLDGM